MSGRPRPDADRMTVAELTGAAQRHAQWRELTEAETADAVAELQEIAGDRADLLAEVAGLLLGAREGALDEPKAKAAAALCIKAGADVDQVPQWVEEGRRRAAVARMMPHSGMPRRRPLGHLQPPGRRVRAECRVRGLRKRGGPAVTDPAAGRTVQRELRQP